MSPRPVRLGRIIGGRSGAIDAPRHRPAQGRIIGGRSRTVDTPRHGPALQHIVCRGSEQGRAALVQASSARIGRMSVSTATTLVELLLRLGFDKHRDHFGMLFTQRPFHFGDALLDLGYG
jgi:hypothetical protein